jgi:hypothetical protein
MSNYGNIYWCKLYLLARPRFGPGLDIDGMVRIIISDTARGLLNQQENILHVILLVC